MIKRLLVLMMFTLLVSGVAYGDDKKELSFIALADTHIRNDAGLEELRDFIYSAHIKDQPDFMVILGDLCGHAPVYLSRIKNILDHAPVKVYVISGNHDDYAGEKPEWYESVFGDSNYVFKKKGWQFLMVSSQIDSREFINKTLDSFDRNDKIIYCQHYPMSKMKRIKNIGKASTDSRIKAYFNGHIHYYVEYKINNKPAYTLHHCYLGYRRKLAQYYVVTSEDDNIVLKNKLVRELDVIKPRDDVPSIKFSNLQDGDRLSGEYTVKGESSDDHKVKSVDLRINNGEWMSARGRKNFSYKLDTAQYADGHYLVEARAVDNKGQESIHYGSKICFIQNAAKRSNVRLFQNGIDGYSGYSETKKTLNKYVPEDLECFVWKKGKMEYRHFNVKFDLPQDTSSDFKEVFLTLYCSRENFQVVTDTKRADYTITVGDKVVTKFWPRVDYVQDIIPPIAVKINVTAFKKEIISWIKNPSSNEGLSFKPMLPVNYNFTARSGNNEIISLRPKLELVY